MGHQNCAELLHIEAPERAGESSPGAAGHAAEYGFIAREDLRMFLVACLQASVSVETMARYLGLEPETVREELRQGIEAWNAARRRVSETPARPELRIAASRD